MVDRAVTQAKLTSPLLGGALEVAANACLAQVFRETALGFTAAGRSLPRLTKTLTFTNGAATLSDDVLTGSFADADLYDADDPQKIYAFVPAWEDFIRVYDTRVGYFTVRGGHSVYVIEPGSTYTDGDGIDDTRTLVVPAIPVVPSAAGTSIDAPYEFQVAALDLLVERLKGAPVAA
jgi:hypothetical protein